MNRRWRIVGAAAAALGGAAVLWLWTTRQAGSEATWAEQEATRLLLQVRRAERRESGTFAFLEEIRAWPRPFPQLARLILGEDEARGDTAEELEALGAAALPAMLRALERDRSPAVRRAAAEWFGRVGLPASVPALTNTVLGDSQGTVRATAIEALDELADPRALPALRTALENDPDTAVRATAARALGTLRDREAVPLLLTALQQGNDPSLRSGAADALGELGDPRALLLLAAAANHDLDPDVRASAANALGDMPQPEAQELLSRVVATSQDTRFFDGIAYRLRLEHMRPVEAALATKLLTETNAQSRQAILSALPQVGSVETFDTLARLLESDPEPGIRSTAAEKLARLDPERSQDVLLARLRNERDASVQANIVQQLAALGNPEAVPYISRMLASPRSPSRWSLVRSLKQYDRDQVLPLVLRQLHEASGSLETQVDLIGFLGGQEAPEGLAFLLQNLRPDQSSNLNRSILGALGQQPDHEAENALLQFATRYPTNAAHEAAILALAGRANARTLPPLTNALFHSSSVAARIAAAKAVGSLHDPQLASTLHHALLAESDAHVRAALFESLGLAGDTNLVPFLLLSLEGEADREARAAAATALGLLGNPDAVPGLVRLLERGGLPAAAAAEALGNLGQTSALAALHAALDAGSRAVRTNAAYALALLGAPASVPVLATILRQDHDRQVRKVAADALGYLGAPEALPILTEALQDRDSEVRAYAAWAFGHLGRPEAVPALTNTLEDPNTYVRFCTAIALARLSAEQARPALLRHRQDSDNEGQIAVAVALAFCGDREVSPALVRGLRSDSSWMELAAILALLRIDTDASRGTLERACARQGHTGRRFIELALATSPSKALTQLLQAPDDTLRLYAVHALELHPDPAALPALQRTFRDPEARPRLPARLVARAITRRQTTTGHPSP